MKQLLLLFVVRFVSAGVVATLATLVASLYYVNIAGIDTAEEVMRHRPNAPGSAAAILASHRDHCWTSGEPRGTVTGVILREHANDAFTYLPYTHRLYIPALEQALQDRPRGPRRIDTVLAFCTDRKPTEIQG